MLPLESPYDGAVGSEGWGPNSPSGALDCNISRRVAAVPPATRLEAYCRDTDSITLFDLELLEVGPKTCQYLPNILCSRFEMIDVPMTGDVDVDRRLVYVPIHR